MIILVNLQQLFPSFGFSVRCMWTTNC